MVKPWDGEGCKGEGLGGKEVIEIIVTQGRGGSWLPRRRRGLRRWALSHRCTGAVNRVPGSISGFGGRGGQACGGRAGQRRRKIVCGAGAGPEGHDLSQFGKEKIVAFMVSFSGSMVMASEALPDGRASGGALARGVGVRHGRRIG